MQEPDAEPSGPDNDVAWMPEDTKTRINALLWEVLPGDMTLARAESLAAEIHDMIERCWMVREPGKVAP